MRIRTAIGAVALAVTSVVLAQTNVTVQDTDPRIIFDPLCSPRTTQCSGGWFSFSFTSNQAHTITYGPSDNGPSPNATFTFTGSAIYYYGISSALTAAVTISLDGGAPALVNLTQMYNLNYSSPINYPVFAWSALGLNPSIEHTFVLTFAESDNPSKWAGFDSIVYTAPPTVTSASSSYVASSTQVAASTPIGTSTPSTGSSSSGSGGSSSSQKSSGNGAAIGGAIGGVIGGLALLGLLGFLYWRNKRGGNSGGGGVRQWNIDDHDKPVDGNNGTGAGAGAHSMSEVGAGQTGSVGAWDSSNDVIQPFLVPTGPATTHTGSASVSSPALSSSTLPTTVASPHDANVLNRLPAIRPEDLQRPESIALILQQQKEIMDLLQRQQQTSGSSQTGTSSSHSHGPTSEKARLALQQYQQLQNHNRTSPASLPSLPPGAAPPRALSPAVEAPPTIISPTAEDPHASLASPPPPPAYTPREP